MKELYASQLPKDVRDLLVSLTSEIQTLKIELQEVKNLMAISEADFTLLKNKVDGIEASLTALTDTVNTIQTTVTGQSISISNVESSASSLTTSVSDLQGADLTMNDLITTLATRLTDIEIKHVQMAKNDLTLPGVEFGVTENLTLPSTDEYGSEITWSSSDESIVSSATGVVTRPSYTEGNVSVSLTALINYGEQTESKTFTFNVLALDMTDQEKVDADSSLLTIDSFDEDPVTEGIQVTVSKTMTNLVADYGSTVSWTSSDPAHFAADGSVIRPTFGEPDATVELTATLTNGTATATKTFVGITVLAETAPPA